MLDVNGLIRRLQQKGFPDPRKDIQRRLRMFRRRYAYNRSNQWLLYEIHKHERMLQELGAG